MRPGRERQGAGLCCVSASGCRRSRVVLEARAVGVRAFVSAPDRVLMASPKFARPEIFNEIPMLLEGIELSTSPLPRECSAVQANENSKLACG
jgi:hypothetical protein